MLMVLVYFTGAAKYLFIARKTVLFRAAQVGLSRPDQEIDNWLRATTYILRPGESVALFWKNAGQWPLLQRLARPTVDWPSCKRII